MGRLTLTGNNRPTQRLCPWALAIVVYALCNQATAQTNVPSQWTVPVQPNQRTTPVQWPSLLPGTLTRILKSPHIVGQSHRAAQPHPQRTILARFKFKRSRQFLNCSCPWLPVHNQWINCQWPNCQWPSAVLASQCIAIRRSATAHQSRRFALARRQIIEPRSVTAQVER